MGQVRQRKGVKSPETWVLDVKYVVRNQTDVLEHRNGVKIPKIWVLDLKECIEIFQGVCLESYYFETFNQMHADTSFRNGSGASTKWCETFENMSFGLGMFVARKQETVLEAKTRALNAPRYRFLQASKNVYVTP